MIKFPFQFSEAQNILSLYVLRLRVKCTLNPYGRNGLCLRFVRVKVKLEARGILCSKPPEALPFHPDSRPVPPAPPSPPLRALPGGQAASFSKPRPASASPRTVLLPNSEPDGSEVFSGIAPRDMSGPRRALHPFPRSRGQRRRGHQANVHSAKQHTHPFSPSFLYTFSFGSSALSWPRPRPSRWAGPDGGRPSRAPGSPAVSVRRCTGA